MQSRYAPGICISSVFHMLRRSIWKTGESYYEPEANAGPYANFIRNVIEHVV